VSAEKLQDLKGRLAEITDLRRAEAVLSWDQNVMMPRGGAQARAEQLATLDKLAHELFVSDEVGNLIEELKPYAESLDYDSDDASLIRRTARDYEKAHRVPPELSAEITRAGAIAYEAWIDARRESDFKKFLPYLETNVELKHRYVECFEKTDETYDVLLDDFEEGMKTAEVRQVFDQLKAELLPFIAEIQEHQDAVDDSCLHGSFPPETQREFSLQIIERFGYTDEQWRLDPTVHPFASGSCPTDIRLTTRYADDNLESLFSSMHEFGHGCYEHQVDPSLERTPLCSGVSLGLHESQSRMWENLVGRSLPFWRYFFPRIQQAFPQLGSVELDTWYRAVNKVQPTLIRVDADEVTYNFHVILRFELEQDIVNGTIELADLPELWDAKMEKYLGIDVPDEARGVLQDVHWSFGGLGYFPTYSLGNVMSVQIWERALADMPDLYDQFEQGEFTPLREWLRDNLHRYGRKYTPRETLEKAAGSALDAGPYIRYLKDKMSEVYGIATPVSA
jgi:carboxypeptidase Taq